MRGWKFTFNIMQMKLYIYIVYLSRKYIDTYIYMVLGVRGPYCQVRLGPPETQGRPCLYLYLILKGTLVTRKESACDNQSTRLANMSLTKQEEDVLSYSLIEFY